MYKATLQQQQFDIDIVNQQQLVNGKEVSCELNRLADGGYEAVIDGTRVIADIVSIDKEQKQIVLRIKNKRYTVQIKEPVDLLLEKLGISVKSAKKVNNLAAPMPGLVTKIMVKEGDEIRQGEPLLILEAMKMENVFKAAAAVKVKTIKVEEKQAVEKGEVLIVFE